MSHFPIAYAGNKRREVEVFNYICNILDNDPNIEIIVEPFCGTSAISYLISKKYPGRYSYILNDNNQYLIDLYNKIRYEPEYADHLNNLRVFITCKEEYPKKADTFDNWVIMNTWYGVYNGQYWGENKKATKKLNFLGDFRDFLITENVDIVCMDGLDLIKSSDFNCLLYLDPPYLASDNSFYRNPNMNCYEYLASELINLNSKIILNIEETWFIKIIFKEFIRESYDKKYERSKKKTKHLIITNTT